ncbi:TraR/DksA family transcriptional regulator [Actinoplanes xinjiangensis]|uniref:TraR/DksA family transcriptional regulator n=1 Tax=Actinoplanes xinjiangensis TaxID=512350 RepID=A0A316FWN4_9ACTN|nr:TraR/DksA C4-type zinc finger protein [Actinoplanes xinjiangensis]PWK52056.1 TraR/DksA family transcriptional regulator [Actinoplanes xinjiangensis]GIF37241.1 DnaK suppressor protein [Actinoplanes xinjiangensis]
MTVRDELLRRRAEFTASAAALASDLTALFEASRNTNGDDEHDPEGATIGFERAQLTALLATARQRVADVDEALARMDAGTYGVCDGCGQGIAEQRLLARPFARTCLTCA